MKILARFALAPVLILGLFANAALLSMPRGQYREIVVHHTASAHDDLASIRRAHLQRGWLEAAYHLVLSNGSAGRPLGSLEASWRYRLGLWSPATRSPRHNLRAVHLCVVGNYETADVPRSVQLALGHAVAALQERHGISNARVALHRECSATACPGRYLTRERLMAWKGESATVSPEIAADHRNALARGALAGPLWWALAAAGNALWLLALRACWRFAGREAKRPALPEETLGAPA